LDFGIKMRLAVVLVVLLSWLLIGAEAVGKQLLKDTFHKMLDRNDDNIIDAQDMQSVMSFQDEGDLEKLSESVRVWILKYDLNGDDVIDFAEFEKAFGELDDVDRYTTLETPEQVHLSLTGTPSEIVVVWVTFAQTNASIVEYGMDSNNYERRATGQIYTYNAGFFGWDGWLHACRLTGLQLDSIYYYRVGDGVNWSPQFHFRSPPGYSKPGQRILIFGDMGTVMPFGFVVTNAMTSAHNLDSYDLAVHLGDVSYAGTGSTREWQIVWDLWGRQVEKLAAYMPYQVTLGNHEKYYNFTAYKARLPMQGEESGGYGNYYFSFDYGGVHFVQTCSEDYAAPWHPGSIQYNWIREDLAKAVANRDKVPWIIVTGHRPFYGSTTDGGWENHRIVFEPLLKEFNVDVFLSGHIHAYERTYPVYNYTVDIQRDINRYVNPAHPVHVQIGTAGAMVWERWVRPQPRWSAFRQARYGYAHFEVVNNTALHFEFFSGHVLGQGEGQLSDDFWIVKE